MASSTTTNTEPRTSRGADEGFLARMMRPTQASKSKVHDKVEVKSPPRPSAAAGGKVGKVAKRMSEGSEKDKSKGEQVENDTNTATAAVTEEQGAAAGTAAEAADTAAPVEEGNNEEIKGDADKPTATAEVNAVESKEEEQQQQQPPTVAA